MPRRPSDPSLRGRLLAPRSPRTVVVWLALWLAVVGNLALWRELWTIGGGASIRIGSVGAFVMVFAATVALMALTAWGRAMKPVWIAILVAAGVAQHFMLAYGAVMDATMLANTMQTDPREVRDLLSWQLFGNIALVALPAIAVLMIPIVRTPWWSQLWRNAVLFVAGVGVALAAAFSVYGELAPIVRGHMKLRYMVNPIGGLSSAAWVGLRPYFKKSGKLVAITAGAGLGPTYAGTGKPPLLVVVVGETARADHFGLNGYPRDTTPELARQSDVLSFRHVRSCGTDTRSSVPCMFSALGKAAFEKRKAEQENLLDVLQAAGLAVLWIDNQAGCKEVCDRVPSARTTDLAPDAARGLCGGGECFDPALLVGIDERIAKLAPERRARGVVLVLHQMGSHGPAYYKRSPPALKRFLPECTNTALGDCPLATVINAYDNTIATTDHFLAATIAWLRSESAFAPALLYMSDHGESLGERGLFLHGLPYGMAEEQIQVPFIAWVGPALAERRGLDLACLRGRLDEPLSHDNLYSTVLGLVDVVTPTYQPSLDAFQPCRKPA